MVKSLQSLRGIFALMIFAHHYPWGGQGGQFDAGGDCGVAFFFILSGFVLSLGAAREGSDRPRWLPFMRRRLSHIYPLHIICLILFFLLYPGAHIGLWLPSNLLMLQAWVPVEGVYFSGNAVGWCLSCFLLFYALFPLLWKLLTRRRLLFIVAAAIYIAATIAARPLVRAGMVTPLLYISPLSRLADFLLGILLYCALSAMRPLRLSPALSTLAELSAAAFVIASFALYGSIEARWAVAPFWWPSMAALIAVFFLTREVPGLLTRLLLLPPLLWMGSISFPYYMAHNLTLRALSLALTAAGAAAIVPACGASGALHLVLSLAATLLSGYLLSLLIRSRLFS